MNIFCRISCRWGPSYLRNQQRRQFARHHAGLESRLQLENQADTNVHHRVASIADSRRAKRGLWCLVFIAWVAGLAASSVRHCWLQPCQRQDNLRLECSEALAGHEKWEREEEIASNRSCPRVARQQQFEDLLNSLVCWWLKLIGFKVYSTHWSCEGSSSIRAFPAQLKTWLSYKAYIALQVFRLIVLSCCWVLFIRNHKFSHEIRFVNS